MLWFLRCFFYPYFKINDSAILHDLVNFVKVISASFIVKCFIQVYMP